MKRRIVCFCLLLVLIATPIASATVDISSINLSRLTYEEGVDYLAIMLAACVDGSDEALLEGAKAELQRNLKIESQELDYASTAFFTTYETADEIAVAIAAHMIALEVTTVEDHPVQFRVVAASKNIRYGPEAEYERVGVFTYGTVVTFLENGVEGWVRITDGETTGWSRDIFLAPYEGGRPTIIPTPAAIANNTVPPPPQAPSVGGEAVSSHHDDLFWLALTIMHEAGSNWLSDEHQLMVGNVVLNRVAHPEFPNTISGVVQQRGQYAFVGKAGWMSIDISERAFANAQRLLNGERFLPPNVIFQAEFRQGSGTHHTIFCPTLGSTTFFGYAYR